MFTVRVTAKLLKNLKIKANESPQLSTCVLGDWYCNIAVIKRKSLLICMSEKTLFPILLPARDLAAFPSQLGIALQEDLKKLQIAQDKIEAELSAMQEWTFAKTANRRVLGSMNDFLRMLEFMLDSGETLDELSWRLGDAPCSPLGMSTPIEATKEAFKEKHVELKKFSPPVLRLIKS